MHIGDFLVFLLSMKNTIAAKFMANAIVDMKPPVIK